VFHQLDELLPVQSSLPLDDLLAVALLLYFGITTLKVGLLCWLITVLTTAGARCKAASLRPNQPRYSKPQGAADADAKAAEEKEEADEVVSGV
jgi:hypothetical protein